MEQATSPKHSNSSNSRFNRKLSFWLMMLFILIILILLRYYTLYFYRTDRVPAQEVVTSAVQAKDVPVYLFGLGTVTPIFNITVKTQINGQLSRVVFTEGQIVRTGDLLAEIDQRPYLALLEQDEGQLARDQALLANALIDLARYQVLWKQNSISKQTLDTQAYLVQQYEGAIKLDEGLIQTVKVNLIYTRIISPITGRIGLRLVDAGNIVQTSDPNGIAVIDSLDPITVIFTLPEDDVQQVLKQVNAGKTLLVKVYDRDQENVLGIGTLLTIDNQIDTTTGTVKLRAQINNHDLRLFPNQFVNVALLVETLPHSLVVPTAAIQYSQQGPFVYLVNKNKTVSAKPVVTGVTFNNDTMIFSGLSLGQQVVTEGTDRLTEGSKVIVSKPIMTASIVKHSKK